MKIDTTQIAGYADMSTEDKLKALEGYEIPEPDMSGYVTKEVFDQTAHDLAKYKKDARAASATSQQSSDKIEELQAQIDVLVKEKTVSSYKSKFLAQGYSEDLAADTAQALADNDMDKVFANNMTFLAERDKAKAKQAMIKDGQKPASGSGNVAVDYDKLIKDARANGNDVLALHYMRAKQEGVKK